MDDQASSRKRRLPQERQAQILEAAYGVFAEAGFSDARMEDIARQAGVSKGTIYLYYPNKQALFEALIRRDLAPRVTQLAQFMDGYDGPVAPLLERAVDMVAMLINSGSLPIYPKLLISEAGRFPELAIFYRKEIVGVALAALARLFSRAAGRGEIADFDPDMVAHLFFAPILKTMVWHFTFAATDEVPFPVHKHLRAHVALFLRGLKPDQGASVT